MYVLTPKIPQYDIIETLNFLYSSPVVLVEGGQSYCNIVMVPSVAPVDIR